MLRVPTRRTVVQIVLIAAVAAAGTVPGAGATTSGATIALSPSIGPPTTFTVITGTGFGAPLGGRACD